MKICVSLYDFIKYAVGEIYYLAPYHKPRFIEEITDEIIINFKKNCQQIGDDFFYHEIALKDLYEFISDILMPIDKFRELNLSQREYEQGVSVDDENRGKFQFVDRYTSIPDYDNFIDLDACIQNIFCSFEHPAFRIWAYGETDLDKLMEFRKRYKELES